MAEPWRRRTLAALARLGFVACLLALGVAWAASTRVSCHSTAACDRAVASDAGLGAAIALAGALALVALACSVAAPGVGLPGLVRGILFGLGLVVGLTAVVIGFLEGLSGINDTPTTDTAAMLVAGAITTLVGLTLVAAAVANLLLTRPPVAGRVAPRWLDWIVATVLLGVVAAAGAVIGVKTLEPWVSRDGTANRGGVLAVALLGACAVVPVLVLLARVTIGRRRRAF